MSIKQFYELAILVLSKIYYVHRLAKHIVSLLVQHHILRLVTWPPSHLISSHPSPPLGNMTTRTLDKLPLTVARIVFDLDG